uniref:Arkadia (RNF111) N-terminal like PKA signaling regulator 2N n=1 Tax=Acanthochromis polyacanthus TaxID=80966 RepID=A0A3Q1FA94_9TELE
MKMADSEKAEEFVDAECPPECLDEAQSATASEGEQSLLSMPFLMKELRRDSPESQHASTGSDKPVSRHIYESDSSNPCMLSPSSSGHLADSDTLSSGEERAAPPVCEEEEGSMEAANDPGQAAARQASATASGGRKSRRSRSESEMPPSAMAAKKNRCQPAVVAAGGQEKQTNGKLAKVKGHRSQKHKERMRLLRQKREAAARKKYNLLQDSSTSDSELTCDSSTSSSEDDDDDTSGGSKTIKTDIPGNIHLTPTPLNNNILPEINIASSDSEVEIVGVQEKARCAHPCGGVIKSLSSWKESSVEQLNSTNQSQLWTTVSPQPNWVSPPEVVDLTLDEDPGHKYLL